MSKVQSFSLKEKSTGSFDLPADFAGKENGALVAQAVHVYRHRGHIGTALTKDRGDVVRTTKKWFRQKGTGHARHGARSAPIFVGGGVAHGPDGLRRLVELPQKMRKEALRGALAMKLKENHVVVAEGLSSIAKTKDANSLISKISEETKQKRFTVVISKENQGAQKAFRNLSNVDTLGYEKLNAYAVIFGGVLVLDSEVFPKKEAKAAAKKTVKKQTKKETK